MKKNSNKFLNFLFFLFLACICLHSSYSSAEEDKFQQPEGNSSIAIVDVEKIIEGLDSFIEFKKNIEEEKALSENQMESKVNKLREEDEDLKSKISILSEEALRDKTMKLQERYMKLQEEVRDKVAEFQRRLNLAIEIIDKELRIIVSELVKEKKYSGYSIVLNRQVVLYYSEKDDLTIEVLKRLNRKKLKLEKKTGEKK